MAEQKEDYTTMSFCRIGTAHSAPIDRQTGFLNWRETMSEEKRLTEADVLETLKCLQKGKMTEEEMRKQAAEMYQY